MKITRFTAENIKRLYAVSIEPDQNEPIVNITGPNAAGKSSVLDSIWMALGGSAAVPEMPVRKGATSAQVTLDLGDILVTRTFTHKGTCLKVSNKDGLEWESAQTLLNTLVGKLAFDPRPSCAWMPPGTAKSCSRSLTFPSTTAYLPSFREPPLPMVVTP